MRSPGSGRRNSSLVRARRALRGARNRNRPAQLTPPRASAQSGEALNDALGAFAEQLPSVSAAGEEDESPRPLPKEETDEDAPKLPLLKSAWPAERAQQRAFLAQTAASWALIAAALAAYVLLLSASGHGEAVHLALIPWLRVSKARARPAAAHTRKIRHPAAALRRARCCRCSSWAAG